MDDVGGPGRHGIGVLARRACMARSLRFIRKLKPDVAALFASARSVGASSLRDGS